MKLEIKDIDSIKLDLQKIGESMTVNKKVLKNQIKEMIISELSKSRILTEKEEKDKEKDKEKDEDEEFEFSEEDLGNEFGDGEDISFDDIAGEDEFGGSNGDPNSDVMDYLIKARDTAKEIGSLGLINQINSTIKVASKSTLDKL